jgi:hypothetical protein
MTSMISLNAIFFNFSLFVLFFMTIFWLSVTRFLKENVNDLL